MAHIGPPSEVSCPPCGTAHDGAGHGGSSGDLGRDGLRVRAGRRRWRGGHPWHGWPPADAGGGRRLRDQLIRRLVPVRPPPPQPPHPCRPPPRHPCPPPPRPPP